MEQEMITAARTSTPYFNIINEISISAIDTELRELLRKQYINEFLARSRDYFELE